MSEVARSKAGTAQLTFLIYGACCAGAFGLEEMVGSSGPGVALTTLLLMPFVWSIPVALACAELTAAFPVEGGNYRWSRMSLGDFWGFQAGWWNWMANFATNGAFAVLFVNYLKYWLPHLGAIGSWGVAVALIWALTFVNFFGIRVVGNAAIVMSLLLLAPFVALTLLGLRNALEVPYSPFVAPGKTLLGAFSASAMLAIWLYSGYDKLSTAAGEVDEPQRSFPRALFFAAGLAVASYVLPTVASLASVGGWESWGEGHFSELARILGGPALGSSMTAAALVSNALLLNVTLLSSSRLPFAMAQDGFLPPFLARLHPGLGTPHVSLMAQGALLSLLALTRFSQLVVIYAWLQMAAYILILVNLWKMRRSHGDESRPFRVPGGSFGLALTVIPPILLALAAMAGTIYGEDGWNVQQIAIGAAALSSGPIAYAMALATRAAR